MRVLIATSLSLIPWDASQDATDPRRTQLKLKRLRRRLEDEIDVEIELGDATLEDKAALQTELAKISDGDKQRRKALRGIAVLAAQELPELEVMYPAAAALERWDHLPSREFTDYSDVAPFFANSDSGGGRHLLKATLDDRTVVLKGYNHISGLKQLEREIEALKVLQHSNIIAAYGACRQQTSSGSFLSAIRVTERP